MLFFQGCLVGDPAKFKRCKQITTLSSPVFFFLKHKLLLFNHAPQGIETTYTYFIKVNLKTTQLSVYIDGSIQKGILSTLCILMCKHLHHLQSITLQPSDISFKHVSPNRSERLYSFFAKKKPHFFIVVFFQP